MRSQIPNPKVRIVIAGAGPAGASLAIRLALREFDVTLIERETFPRHKLCGEFISPECIAHFGELGVLDDMLSAGGEQILETRFYAPGGRSFSVSSSSFRGDGYALSLSRSEMDMRLLQRARSVGVTAHEDSSVNAVSGSNGRIETLTIRQGNGNKFEIAADLFVDATGRSRVIQKLAAKNESRSHAKKSLFVGYKSHFRGALVAKNTCEIYLFPGGYGGVSPVGVGLTNHCFFVRSSLAREFGGDAGQIVENVVFNNTRARETLAEAERSMDWLAVSVDRFGKSEPAPAVNVVSIGDSAAFIDPFTGSGMLLAFESSALLAKSIELNRTAADAIKAHFMEEYDGKFSRRLRVCSILRRAAFIPHLPKLAVSLLSFSKQAREMLADSTRSPKPGLPKIR